MESQRRALRGVAEKISKSISHGDTVGLGSGSTVAALLEELAPLLVARKAEVILSDVSDWRLKFAEAGGFGTVLDARRSDVQAAVRSETEGRGADLAIVASGSQAAVAQGVKSVRKGGRVCLFGIPVEGSVLEYPLSDFYGKELALVTSYGASEVETKEALKVLVDNQAEFARLITHKFPLAEFEKGVSAIERGIAMKVAIVP